MFEKMKKVLNESEFNESVTENGAIGYKSSGSKLLDLNFKVPSLRTLETSQFDKVVAPVYAENPLLFAKWLFFLRDCREGLGEKRSFKEMYKVLINLNETYAVKLLHLVPEYGSWKDLVELSGTSNKAVANEAKRIISEQFSKDIEFAKKKEGNISLLGKWLPSINAGKKAHNEAIRISRMLQLTFGEYRKSLSLMREYIDIVERHICAKEFDKIDYSKVPSIAGLKYRSLFAKHDGQRYIDFMSAVVRGEQKVNSSVLYPHDIYREYTGKSSVDDSIEAYWKNLPNNVDDDKSTIVVCDGSGSMYQFLGKSDVMAIDISRSLSIYFSERLKGEFKDKFIEFSSEPKIIDLHNCTTLFEKRKVCESYNDWTNTNIEAVFDLILKTAIDNRMRQEEMPDNILIVSDMEFDTATYSFGENVNEKLFNEISLRYANNGYKMPKLVFWNVCSRTNTIPLLQNDLGVTLVSGFSTNICKMICNNETDPYKAMLTVLESYRYEPISKALAN